MTVGQVTLDPRSDRSAKASEIVAQRIVRDIVRRGLPTGARLPLEAEMISQYRVSRATLREALRLLEFQGLISLKPGPGGGPVVGTVEPAYLARTASLYFHLGSATYGDLMVTQVLLESSCAALAAGHPDRAEVMAPWRSTPLPGDLERFRDLTVGFHGSVYQLCGNPALSLLTQSVTHIVTLHVISTRDPVELRSGILSEHETIADVIAAGDRQAAQQLTVEHFERQHHYVRDRAPERLADFVEWR